MMQTMDTLARVVARRGAVSLLLVLVVLLGSAGAPAAADSPSAAPPRASSEETIHAAYDLMLDRFVHPLGSATLLGAAWAGASQAAGVPNAPTPSFSGDR